MRFKDALLLILVLALGATSLGLWQELKLERDRAEAMQNRFDSQAAPATGETVTAGRPPNPAGKLAAVESNGDPLSSATLDFSRMKRPDETFWEFRRNYLRLKLGRNYEDAAKVLGIGEAKGNALIDLLTDQLYQNERAANELGNNSTPEEWEHTLVQRRQENQAEIASFLGEQKFAKWLDYQASQPTRMQVRDFGRELALSGEPLKPNQVEPLVELIHSERMKARQELGEYQIGMYPGDDADWEAFNEVVFGRNVELMEATDEQIVKSAGPLLSIAQAAALEKMLKHQRDLYSARLQMMEAGKSSAIVETD